MINNKPLLPEDCARDKAIEKYIEICSNEYFSGEGILQCKFPAWLSPSMFNVHDIDFLFSKGKMTPIYTIEKDKKIQCLPSIGLDGIDSPTPQIPFIPPVGYNPSKIEETTPFHTSKIIDRVGYVSPKLELNRLEHTKPHSTRLSKGMVKYKRAELKMPDITDEFPDEWKDFVKQNSSLPNRSLDFVFRGTHLGALLFEEKLIGLFVFEKVIETDEAVYYYITDFIEGTRCLEDTKACLTYLTQYMYRLLCEVAITSTDSEKEPIFIFHYGYEPLEPSAFLHEFKEGFLRFFWKNPGQYDLFNMVKPWVLNSFDIRMM